MLTNNFSIILKRWENHIDSGDTLEPIQVGRIISTAGTRLNLFRLKTFAMTHWHPLSGNNEYLLPVLHEQRGRCILKVDVREPGVSG